MRAIALAGVLLIGIVALGCGSDDAYTFDLPDGFQKTDPKEVAATIGTVRGQHQTLLTSSDANEPRDFIRIYSVHVENGVGDVKEQMRQLLPVFQKQLNTRVLAQISTTVGGMEAVRTELLPGAASDLAIGSWLTVAATEKTAYFIQCQWKRTQADRKLVTTACQKVLGSFTAP